MVFCHVEGVEVSQPVSTPEGGEMSKSNEEERVHVVSVFFLVSVSGLLFCLCLCASCVIISVIFLVRLKILVMPKKCCTISLESQIEGELLQKSILKLLICRH